MYRILVALFTHRNYTTKYDVNLDFEIGSDRWGYRAPVVIEEFIANTMSGLKRHGIDLSKVIFVVTDVGTSVKLGSRVNPLTVETFSN
uniref:Uncharacterized protein n=1 Tax=Ignisphaera aggregans TaxID=334771 RepID=A0A7J3Z8M7_9CREN